MGKKPSISVALDIGTSRVLSLVVEAKEDSLDVIGFGMKPSNTLKNGMIIDMEKTVNAIREAVAEAEGMAGCEINKVFVGIGGSHIQSFNGDGAAKVKDNVVTEADMKRAINQARLVSITPDREIIHIIPQEYIVDDQDGIMNPRGISGSNIKVKVHIVTGLRNRIEDLRRCVNSAGLDITAMILNPLASSESVLTEDEMQLGVISLDIGGGTAELSIYRKGSIIHTSVIGIGGEDITVDIASGLSTSKQSAEMIKIQYGCVLPSLVPRDETIEVPDMAGGKSTRKYSRRLLAEIIQPKVEELLELVSQNVGKVLQGRCSLPGGIVLTGGTANLQGLVEFTQQFLGFRARVGYPRGLKNYEEVVSNPAWATNVGLILAGRNIYENGMRRGIRRGRGISNSESGFFNHLLNKARLFLSSLCMLN